MPKNLKITAVICEFNPLHKGHAWLLEQAKQENEGVICVLSGNFVQRGDGAILDKWARTRLALEHGADLVIELPLSWACAGAERFAAGGVALANALGCAESLTFGCETEDVDLLENIVQALLSAGFSEKLKGLPDDGSPFAKRRELVLTEMLGEPVVPILQSPNAILGVEYIKAIRQQSSPMRPIAVLRRGADHDSIADDGEFHSASALRAKLLAGEDVSAYLPEGTAEMIGTLKDTGAFPCDLKLLDRSVLCKLRSMTLEEFAALPDVSEGLEHRLYAAARQAGSLEEFYASVKSKRYSHARIRRLTLYAFLGVRSPLPALPPYLRVLGMSDIGEEILRLGTAKLPIIARGKDAERLCKQSQDVFSLECRADDLYGLAAPIPRPCGRDFTEKLVRI